MLVTNSGAYPGLFNRGGGGGGPRVFPKMSEVEGTFLELNGSPPIGGVWGDSPRKIKLRFQAMKSAFWWILEMGLLCIMVKEKTLSSDRGVRTPPTFPLDPPL